jgi:hypothetical protein
MTVDFPVLIPLNAYIRLSIKTTKPMTFKSRLLLLIVITITACNQPNVADLPEVVSLSKLKQTEFVPTLENDISNNKNVIYAPSFLFAWDKVKQLLNAPVISSGSNSADFSVLNQSNTFKNSLNEDEYEAKATADGGIVAEAFFNKALPFSKVLQKINSGILFGKTHVKAFGMNTLDHDIEDFIRILFYKNDDNFILQLTPRDTLNQILLVKGLRHIQTLNKAIEQTNALTKQGYQQERSNSEAWKYIFYDSDSFAIPVIRFNIETNYKNLEGQSFTAGGNKQTIQTAYQRTAFSLDENGAVIESQAMASLDSIGGPQHPKRLFFDKPFFIIIKHTGQVNPYFVMRVGNGELMVRK